MTALNNESSEARFLRVAIVLGLLSAIGPFAIDMYLPALPSIGKDLTTDPATVQMSLLAFFVAMGLGQIVVGPISDMIGRKGPMYLGLGLFVLGSIGSAMAPGIHWLIVFRLIQGFGACPGMVVPRAVVRDLHTGTEAARLMSLLMLVFSVSVSLSTYRVRPSSLSTTISCHRPSMASSSHLTPPPFSPRRNLRERCRNALGSDDWSA